MKNPRPIALAMTAAAVLLYGCSGTTAVKDAEQ